MLFWAGRRVAWLEPLATYTYERIKITPFDLTL